VLTTKAKIFIDNNRLIGIQSG